LLKNASGQKAANELSITKTQMKTYPVGLLKYEMKLRLKIATSTFPFMAVGLPWLIS
jgi:hypothetical protein